MPAILTHDFFGKDAFGSAIDALGLYTPDERDAFLLGNQGPDPLFYLKPLPPLADFQKLGVDLHREAPTELLVQMRKVADDMSGQDARIARAYLGGFVCHYLLDRAMHPLVDYWERGICEAGVEGLDLSDHSIVHAEIERDLDEMVLYAKRNQTIETYRPYREVLRIRDEALDVIGRLYFEARMVPDGETEPTLSQIFPLATRCFRVAQRVFWSPKGIVSGALGLIEPRLTRSRYSLLQAMSQRPRAEKTSVYANADRRAWRNPFSGVVSNASFDDLYEAALAMVTPALERVFSQDFDEASSAELTRGLNFSGECVE